MKYILSLVIGMSLFSCNSSQNGRYPIKVISDDRYARTDEVKIDSTSGCAHFINEYNDYVTVCGCYIIQDESNRK
jgi:hypothetical protein